jgi:hypothetical protein
MAKKNTMIGNFMGTMVGIPLVGASASMANAMPAGMAKDLTGTAVGLQGVALVGHSLGAVPGMSSNRSYKKSKSKKSKRR